MDVGGKRFVRVKDRGKVVQYPLTKDGAKYLRPAKVWYFEYKNQLGIVKRVKGFTDLKATEQLAADAERKVARMKAGLIDPAEEHALRPLSEHLEDYSAALQAKGNTPEHNAKTIRQVERFLRGCGFVYLADTDAGKASAWLNAIRANQRSRALPVGVEQFPVQDVVSLLEISREAIAKAIAVHQLEVLGNGKSREYPRATVQALADRAARGNAPQTINHYVRAIRGFFRWLVKLRRIGANPLESLTLLNPSTDIRRARRALTREELRLLLTGTRESRKSFRNLSGEDRFTLYLVGVGTGFRSNALANLTPADFDLTADTPTVTLPARFAKNRKTQVQPLPADVAETMRVYLAGKPTALPVWGGTWASGCQGAGMLRRDLEAVGIPYAVEGPDGPEYADFHSLRHTYLTMLGRNGVDLRTIQELAGHSTPTLTARYMHVNLHDAAGAVDRLPHLMEPANSEPRDFPLRLTGTDGAYIPRAGAVPGAVKGAGTGGATLHRSAQMCSSGDENDTREVFTEVLQNKPSSTILQRSAPFDTTGASGIRTRNQGIMSPLL